MIKPKMLKQGDKIAIVSLSSGVLGEDFAKHQVQIAQKRFESLGLVPIFMPNALKGIDYIANHPEKRADDLKMAFADPSIRGIFCAIGGMDTFKIAPFLLDDPEFIRNVRLDPKLFTGFSDTTNNHFLFYKLGMVSYYGPNVLNDIAELAPEMLPYTKETVKKFFSNDAEYHILSSPIWYEERKDFSEQSLNTNRIEHKELKGYEVLCGEGKIMGRLLGGCIESIYDMLVGERFPEQPGIVQKYDLFPSLDQWQDKILFLETSEEKPSVGRLTLMLKKLKDIGVLDVISALIVGKPQDEQGYEDYKEVLTSLVDVPILYNVNFGHAYPRAVLPYGLMTEIDFDNKEFKIIESMFVV